MEARFSTIRQRLGIWPIAVSVLMCALGCPAAEAYLALVGPAPLRFEPVRTWTPRETPAAPLLAAPAAQATEIPDSAERLVPTNPPVLSGPGTASTNDVPAAFTAAPGEQTTVLPSAPPPDSAGDLLLVTPQMLTEYFKPAPGQTNRAPVAVFVPVAIGFKPPAPPSPASSQATYRSP